MKGHLLVRHHSSKQSPTRRRRRLLRNAPSSGIHSDITSFLSFPQFPYRKAGEERYALTMNKDKSVHYEVSSLSKPDHFLSRLGYPVVCALQVIRLSHFSRRK
uniref:DUF1990 domain-containing protein n=1 Tax=Phaeocystis cordata TaxID=118079 RepID=A0A7S1HQK6_9EUKA|mmetsp:Transcript_2179/g.5096  ORF Transcript_2179/g.5096 Transcript_2179/m.5096 type:complete len:103 (+) Transcript_2179:140-448(+)